MADPAPPGEGLLPEILAPDLDVIFVGAAPSVCAARSGHYYAGPRNRFWSLLWQAGLTPRLLRADEDSEVLRFGIGLTAIHPGLISTSNALLPEPTEEQRERLRARLAALAPGVVCYNGKDVYRMCTGAEAGAWGPLPERVGAARVFVAHSTSGRADRWGADRFWLFRELRRLVEELRAERPGSPGARPAIQARDL